MEGVTTIVDFLYPRSLITQVPERDPGVDVAALRVKVGRVHWRRQLRLPRRHQPLLQDVVPVPNPGKEWVVLDVVGAAGSDPSGLGEL